MEKSISFSIEDLLSREVHGHEVAAVVEIADSRIFRSEEAPYYYGHLLLPLL